MFAVGGAHSLPPAVQLERLSCQLHQMSSQVVCANEPWRKRHATSVSFHVGRVAFSVRREFESLVYVAWLVGVSARMWGREVEEN